MLFQLLFLVIFSAIIHQAQARKLVSDVEYASMPVLFHLDDLDHCLLHDANQGLYCFTTFQLNPENPKNPSETWKIIEKVSSDSSNYRHDIIRHGICVPETCPNVTAAIADPNLNEKIAECYNAKYKRFGLVGQVVKAQCQDKNFSYPKDTYHYAFAVFMVVYVSVVVFATLYEGVARYKTNEEYEKLTGTQTGKLISAFSLTKNWMRLKQVDLNNPEVSKFRFIQGIRFYNMILVILTHTAMLNLAAPVTNPIYAESVADNVFNIFLSSGGFCMQTSFMLSTCLLTYNLLNLLEGKKDVSYSFLAMAFVHRLIRLTPALFLVWAFHSTWFVNISNGPFWDTLIGEEYRRCRSNGWSNLLYINNYVNQTEMCMPQTWYMACDTQFFIVALLLIKYIKKNEKRVYWVFAGLIALQVAILFPVFYVNNWESTMRPNPEYMYAIKMLEIRQWHVILSSNYSNLTGLAGGFLLGYLFHKYRNRNVFTTKTRVALWWIGAFGSCLAIVVIPGVIMYSDDYQHNRLYAALYGSLCKIVFIAGMSVGLFGYMQGVGWCAKWTLEWPPTYVLGRLTYGAYVVHLTFQRIRQGSRRNLTYLNDYFMIGELITDLAFGYFGALVIALLFEMPTTELLKLVMKQPSGRKEKKREEKIKDK